MLWEKLIKNSTDVLSGTQRDIVYIVVITCKRIQSVTAVLCLNGVTSVCAHIDDSCTPALTDIECTVLQRIVCLMLRAS